jgi:uncharacterized membrane protein
MKHRPETLDRCVICGQQKPVREMMELEVLRHQLVDLIKRQHPDLPDTGHICLTDLAQFRAEAVREILKDEKGELSEHEIAVINAIKERELLSTNSDAEFESALTLGERLSDRMAGFGGSWTFIISFGVVLLIWISINVGLVIRKPYDPYPFILLNLILSCVAALQAPVIMMSQNRQEAKDRQRAVNDYQVNLKAELEVRALNEKIDHLLHHQWHQLLEIQQIQTDLIEELVQRRPGKPASGS